MVKPKNRPLLLLQLTLITFWNFFLFTLPSHLYSNDHMTLEPPAEFFFNYGWLSNIFG